MPGVGGGRARGMERLRVLHVAELPKFEREFKYIGLVP